MPPPPLTAEQEALAARQAQRWADPATQQRAARQAQLASERARADEPRVQGLLKQLDKAPKIQHRIFWLRQLADAFADAVAPHSACVRGGCDACCRQPVAVTQEEADLIARETGAPLARPAGFRASGDERYIGQPCSFLREGRCTIYAARPMACRLMFSMDVDDLLCHRVPGALSHMPYADYSQHKELYVRAHLGKVRNEEEMRAALARLRLADIREFFPEGLAR